MYRWWFAFNWLCLSRVCGFVFFGEINLRKAVDTKISGKYSANFERFLPRGADCFIGAL